MTNAPQNTGDAPDEISPALPEPSPEKMKEAIDALIYFHGQEDNYFTRAASEQYIREFIQEAKDQEIPVFDDILTGHISLLNVAFQRTMLAATSPRGGYHAVAQAVRLSAQLTRNIDTWRRLKDFENRQTK